MLRAILTLAVFCCFTTKSTAQQKWNLQTIVDYAMANNINVKLSDVQAKVAAINYTQSKASQYPNASFSANTGLSSGNNQDPVTFNRLLKLIFLRGCNYKAAQTSSIFIVRGIQ
jgi:outer membrane protein TolC